MHFVLYTEKSVSESLKSINERLHVKGTNSRPGLDGWIDKSGMFSMSVNGSVVGNLRRRTSLRARLQRESGYTIVRGDVPSGASPTGIGLMVAAMAAVGLFLLTSGNTLLALAVIPVAAILFIVLRGDDVNSEYLLDELMRTLRAKETPPKTAPKKTSAAPARTAAKPASKAAASKPKTAANAASRTETGSNSAARKPTTGARPPSTPSFR